MMLSIVIPTLNEEKYLPNLLSDLRRQTYKDFEIIVSDARSNDNTAKIARKYGCRVVFSKRKCPARGRNVGAKVARGKYLLFLDADVRIPDRDSLKILMDEVKRKNIKLATFYFRPYDGNRLDILVSKILVLSLKIISLFEPFSPGFCTLISKDIHEKIGGYNEDLFMAEDHDYVKRASKFTKFFVLSKPHILYSLRRLKHEGRLKLYLKYIFVTLYRALNGEITKKMFDYKFGGY
ncbi:MAG: glycosyltransferase [Candidatus Aenigmarchaeota archaeon]|nr:glycosyltransferase [Candidatus Aenigmarchaeota archaeon]